MLYKLCQLINITPCFTFGGVAELGKCHGTWFWGHDSSTYIYCVNIVIVAYSVQFAFSDSLHLR